MREGDKVEKPERSVEEMLQLVHEKNQKMHLYELKFDRDGNYLLDPSNSHHRQWMDNDEDY